MSILRVKDKDGNIIPIPAIQGPPGKSGTIDETTVTTMSGLLKGSGGKIAPAVAETDYATPAQVNGKQDIITASGLLKGDGAHIVSAVAGTDYATAAQVDAKLDKTGGTVSGDLTPDMNGNGYLGSEAKRWNSIHAYTGRYYGDISVRNTLVVSSGSNSNGNWVKFYDGTMICWMTKDFGLDDVVNPWGVLFDGKEQQFPDFPVPFVAPPVVTLTPSIPDTLGSYMLEGPKGVTSSSPGIFWASRPSNTEELRVVASYIAVGRWK